MIKRFLGIAMALGLVCAAVGAQDITWRNNVQPIFEASCAACHGANSPVVVDWKLDEANFAKKMVGPRLNTYIDLMSFVVWPDTGAIMRRLDDGKNVNAGGKPGNMYVYLGKTDAERAANLKTIKDWLGGEAAWNLNRWGVRGTVPAVTKEQLATIKAKY